MEKVKKCIGCVWYDKCPEEEACEDYDPIDEEEMDELRRAEYELELRRRQSAYISVIKELEE